MPIIAADGFPEDGPVQVERALRDLLRPRSTSPGDASGGRAASTMEEVTISSPLPIYLLTPTALLRDGGVDAAELVGWRYVVTDSSDGASFVDLAQVEGAGVEFAQLSTNDNADALLGALREAERVVVSTRKFYEITTVDMPSFYVSAVWMKGFEHNFIPYVMPPGFPSELLSADPDLMGKLASIARSDARWNDAPEPSDSEAR